MKPGARLQVDGSREEWRVVFVLQPAPGEAGPEAQVLWRLVSRNWNNPRRGQLPAA